MILTRTIELKQPDSWQTTAPVESRITAHKVRQSSGALACCLFVLLNFAAAIAYQSRSLCHSPTVNAACETGEIDPKICLKDWTMFMWALQDGFERTLDARLNRLATVDKPDVFLFGSSLMIFPLWFADHGNNLPDSAYYNFHSAALQQKCSQPHKIFNMSLALMNASDADRVVERYFDGAHRPKVLVYGVGPRDFYDSFVSSPSASVYFGALSNFDDYTKNSQNYFANAYDESLNIGKRAYFLFNKRADFLLLGKSLAKQFLHVNKATVVEPLTDMGPGRNLGEYEGHYKNISAKAFDPQMGFLNRLLQVCAKRHIRVIMVGMPLTQENRALLPAHVHQAFTEKLSTLAVANGQKFLDLNGGEFQTGDFLDSAHLNETGAHKFVDLLAPIVDAEMQEANSNAHSNADISR